MAISTTYDDLLARARALVATTDRIPVIGISGHGGSGKSTLAGGSALTWASLPTRSSRPTASTPRHAARAPACGSSMTGD